jgi:hypothetical protein
METSTWSDRLVEGIGRLHVRNGFRNSLRPAQWQALRFYRDHSGTPLGELARDRHSPISAACSCAPGAR